jgi:hypothetical protein
MKNYIGFLTDHSGSMHDIRNAALKDYNDSIKAVREAATANMLDTIVSVFGFGGKSQVTKHVVNSNPHVLTPMVDWSAQGNTPLYDAIGDMITLLKSMPDYDNPKVSFLIMLTSDGEEYQSIRYTKEKIAEMIGELRHDERWTIVCRIPSGCRRAFDELNIPADNIQEWDVSEKGIGISTQSTTVAMNNFYAQRAKGLRGSSTFYANAAHVTQNQVKASLQNISAEVSLWTVLPEEDGIEIKPFAEKRLGTMPFLKGAAFYQLSKTEARVQETKMIIIRDKSTGHVYFGEAARDMIGLPRTGNARVHPGNHGNYDIFIQSTSINRKLVAGTQLMYWPKVGVGFTAADFPWLTNGQSKIDPTLVQKSTAAIQATAGMQPAFAQPYGANPVVKTNITQTNDRTYYPSRDECRLAARKLGTSPRDAGKSSPTGQRWFIPKV